MLKTKQLPLMISILFATGFAVCGYADDSALDNTAVISDADAIVTSNNGAPLISKRNVSRAKQLHSLPVKKYTGDAEAVARGFLQDQYQALGISADLGDLHIEKVDKTPERNHVRWQQTVAGVPVEGGEILVHSDQEGQVTLVQNHYVSQPELANRDVLTEALAAQIARDDLTTVVGASELSVSTAEKRIVLAQGKYRYVWRVVTSTRQPMGYWVYRIDAESGAILYKANEITSLKKGTGKVYKSNKDYVAGKVSLVSLPNMFTTAEGYTAGYLWGVHADIYDYNGNDPFSPKNYFLFNQSTQKDSFDATNAYYQLDKIWKWWRGNVTKYTFLDPGYFYSYSIPTIVNVDTLCNAFYTPDLNGDGSNFPGFVFGDENACAAGSEDLVLDDDVFRHEFAHAMMDWSGPGFQAQYGGSVDHYGRAMGEGNADWYAYLYSKDPKIGEVAFGWLPDGYLRTLDNTRRYPVDVDDPFGGVPEEHYTGEIWEGYLYDVYRVLKTPTSPNKSIPYVFRASYYFSPGGGFVDGEPDFQDAIVAAAAAELDITGKLASTAKVWGSMASRGINAALRAPYSHASDYFGTGSAGADDSEYFMFDFPAVSSITTKSNMLTSGDVHEYVINVTTAGLTLTATVTGQSSGLNTPTVELYGIGGGAPLASIGPSLTNNAVLTYTNLPIGIYVITVTGNAFAPARGYYTFKVTARTP